MVSAEAMVSDGDVFPTSLRSPARFAEALAWLVAIAPKPAEVPSLAPSPPWTGPDLASSDLWPVPDDRTGDLNATQGPRWLDQAGQVARERLAASVSAFAIGHGDWYTANLRWKGNTLHTVWDWDSAIAASEPAIAGLAAAVYPVTDAGTEATVTESESFLSAYQNARGLTFSDDELAEAWAAGLWARAFEAKKRYATDGLDISLSEAEASERRRRVLGQ